MILFVRYDGNPNVKVVNTATPQRWLETVASTARSREEMPRAIGVHPSNPGACESFLDQWRHLHTRQGEGWYHATPELLAFIAAKPEAVRGGGMTGRPVKIDDETARQIFLAVHEEGETGGIIGLRYGVSPMTVSNISRGLQRGYLFDVHFVRDHRGKATRLYLIKLKDQEKWYNCSGRTKDEVPGLTPATALKDLP